MGSTDDRSELPEIFGSVAWFLMDAAWMLEWSSAALVLAVLTVLVNLAVFAWTERSFFHLVSTAAVNAWVGMNVTWMIGDIHGGDAYFVAARCFAFLGAVLVGTALIASLRRTTAREALRRFRRFRS